VLAKLGLVAVPVLWAALRDDNPDVRVAAAAALGQMGPSARPAAPALRAALDDEDGAVRRAAAAALADLRD